MTYQADSHGRFPAHRRDVETRRPGPWAATTFELEDMYTAIQGWMPQEFISRPDVAGERLEPVTWNGWDCPHFDRTGADLIVTQHHEWIVQHALQAGRVYPADLLAGYDAESDSYRFFMVNGYDHDGGHYTGEWETYNGKSIELEPGYSLHLYPVGAWSWTWERVDGQG